MRSPHHTAAPTLKRVEHWSLTDLLIGYCTMKKTGSDGWTGPETCYIVILVPSILIGEIPLSKAPSIAFFNYIF